MHPYNMAYYMYMCVKYCAIQDMVLKLSEIGKVYKVHFKFCKKQTHVDIVSL